MYNYSRSHKQTSRFRSVERPLHGFPFLIKRVKNGYCTDKPFRSFPVPFHSGFSWWACARACARTILRTLKSTCARTIHYSHPSNRRLQRSEVYQPKQDEDVFHIIRDDCPKAASRVSSYGPCLVESFNERSNSAATRRDPFLV